MTLLLLTGFGLFGYRLWNKYRLLRAKAEDGWGGNAVRFIPRLRRVCIEGFGQAKLHDYRGPGIAHHVIFVGFFVLLLRTIVLWGRAYEPGFVFFWFASSHDGHWGFGDVYRTLREYCELLVLVATGYFTYVRLWRRERRLTLSCEGIAILALIATMMIADITYDACGALLARTTSSMVHHEWGEVVEGRFIDFIAPFVDEPQGFWRAPGSFLLARLFGTLPTVALFGIGLVGYYLHVVLVLVFLTLLPVTKHFHILLALPNLFLSRCGNEGKIEPIASSVEQLMAQVATAMDKGDLDDVAIGKARIEHFSSKARLDWLTCTECGRCSEHCPAALTNKSLQPKTLTLALRRDLNVEAPRLLGKSNAVPETIVPTVIEPASVWACTTCRACEEQCPVGISYLDTIVGLRRNLVMMRGEAPTELHRVFDGMERSYNPWNFPKNDRTAWALGLDVPLLAKEKGVEYLFWVGCAASYDERAKAIARSFVRLMRRAKVSFAILGNEERCTGDSARRAGNELLFLQLAEANIALLKRYQDEGRFVRIVTTCPHCLTTLKNDYRDFGGHFDVIHHSDALEQWVREGRLVLREPSAVSITFHDPCTLARYAGVTESPRRLLERISDQKVKEPTHHGRHTLCCGAGGAQMWLEEQNKERMNERRASELLRTNAECIVSACPFCFTMVSDGVTALGKGAVVKVEDLAEVVEKSLLSVEEASPKNDAVSVVKP
jgi:Fe-S oxidoreductase